MMVPINNRPRICLGGEDLDKNGKPGFRKNIILVAVSMGLTALIGFWGYSFFSERVIEQENNLRNYRQANICQTYNCRKIVDATVLNAKTESRVFIFFPKYRDAPLRNPEIGSNASLYVITLSLPDSTLETIKFYPDKEYPFVLSFPNIYFPTGDTFADDNFASGQTVKVEIWNDRITFVLLDSVRGYKFPEKTNLLSASESNAVPRISTTDYSNKIAIPTTNHPVISLADSKDVLETEGRVFFIAFFLIPAIMGLFLSAKK